MQGLNVVLVALQDDLLDSTFEELSAAFPDVEFRKASPAAPAAAAAAPSAAMAPRPLPRSRRGRGP
jgi:hypothetical protein